MSGCILTPRSSAWIELWPAKPSVGGSNPPEATVCPLHSRYVVARSSRVLLAEHTLVAQLEPEHQASILSVGGSSPPEGAKEL